MNVDLGKAIFEALFNDENKNKMIDELNKVVNIPIIGEEMERKIISNLFECMETILKKLMVKDSEG
jgi:hypothetical protein